MFGRLILGWYTIYTFSGALAAWWKFATCNIHFAPRPSLTFSYIGSVTARHSSSGVMQALRRWADGDIYIRQRGHHVGSGPHSGK